MSRGEFSGANAWPLDINRDGRTDRLVQASYTFPGGNSFYVENYVFYATGTGWAEAPLDLPTLQIGTVEQVESGARITHIVRLPDDARCCPTGQQVSLLQY